MNKILTNTAGLILALVGGVGIGVLWWSPSLYGLFFGVALIVVWAAGRVDAALGKGKKDGS